VDSAGSGSPLLGQALAWSCEGHGGGLGHSAAPQLVHSQLCAQWQQNTVPVHLVFFSKKAMQ